MKDHQWSIFISETGRIYKENHAPTYAESLFLEWVDGEWTKPTKPVPMSETYHSRVLSEKECAAILKTPETEKTARKYAFHDEWGKLNNLIKQALKDNES